MSRRCGPEATLTIARPIAAGKIHNEERNSCQPRPSWSRLGRLDSTMAKGASIASGPTINCSRVGSHKTSMMKAKPSDNSTRLRDAPCACLTGNVKVVEVVVAKEVLSPQNRAPKTVGVGSHRIGCRDIARTGQTSQAKPEFLCDFRRTVPALPRADCACRGAPGAW